MLRTILSYSALILIPTASLAMAVAPYVWIKKRIALRQAQHDSIVKWKHLWLAFAVGLVGNIIWGLIQLELPIKISDYIYQVELSGFLFAILFYSIFVAITPFLFFKFRYRKLQVKQIVYCTVLSLLIASLEVGAGIILFFIGWNKLFYAFN